MGKYFKYAIGEILLVVVGILIALQINIWNENRKQQRYEKKMLREIRTALINDKLHMESMLKRLKEPETASIMFIDMIYNKQSFTDSLYSYLWKLRTGTVYQYNPGPYQALKYSGLDKISSDSLRNTLIKFYDFDFPRHMELTEWSDRNYDKNLERLDTFFSGEPYVFITEKGEKRVYKDVPKDLLSNPDFLVYVNDIRSAARGQRMRYESFSGKIQQLIDLIDSVNSP